MVNLQFKVAPKSEIAKQVTEHKKAYQDGLASFREFVKEVGLPKNTKILSYKGSKPHGIETDKDPGPLWKNVKKWGSNRYNPNQRSAAGKELAKRFKTLLPIGKYDFGHNWSETTFDHGWVMKDMKTHFAVCGYSSKGIVVSMKSIVKKKCKQWPKGLTEITGSEVAEIMGE